jgi:hypothetical protein
MLLVLATMLDDWLSGTIKRGMRLFFLSCITVQYCSVHWSHQNCFHSGERERSWMVRSNTCIRVFAVERGIKMACIAAFGLRSVQYNAATVYTFLAFSTRAAVPNSHAVARKLVLAVVVVPLQYSCFNQI